MKLNKIYLAFAAVFALVLASCSSDYEYTSAEQLQNAQVYFSNDLATSMNLSVDKNIITIPVNRVNTDDALTVDIVSSVEGTNYYDIPAQVDFAQGANMANLVISYNPSEIEYNDFSTITLKIAEESYTTPYGVSSYSVKVGIPAPWKTLGKALYREDLVTTFYGVGNIEWEVEIQENELYPGLYRLVYPYDGKYEYNDPGDWDDSKTYYLEINATNPDAVKIEAQQLGMDWGDGMFIVWSFADYYGKRGDDATASAHYGCLKDGIITFPAGSLLISMADYNDGGFYTSNTNGMFRIVLPGFAAKDYSAEVEYSGIFTNAAGEPSVVASLTLGNDATNVKAVVVKADANANAVADAIVAGEIEAETVEAGNITLPIGELTGDLQIVVVVIDDNAAQTIASTKFEYYGGGASPWKSIGTGYYTDDFVVSVFGNAPYTYEVEIEESNDVPGLYRILNAYTPVAQAFGEEGGNAHILIHAEDQDGVYILKQPIGMDLGYGDMSIESEAGGYVAAYDFNTVKEKLPTVFGTLKDGVITLPVLQTDKGKNYQGVLYMGTDGYYGGGNGAFSLVLPNAAKSVKSRAQKAACATTFMRNLTAYNKVSNKVNKNIIKATKAVIK